MSDRPRRKLIEVALPLEAINVASAREKSIRHGHPSTLHMWWARRPLAACRAVLFASLVDDPSSDPDRFPTPKDVEQERARLFGIIERLVLWENTTNADVLQEARSEIRRNIEGELPPVLDPFCGGGSIPLEAQRLGLTALASDLNPVAVLITKAMVEIPATFRDQPPVHPEAHLGVSGSGSWDGAGGLAEDIRRYGGWIAAEAARSLMRFYPPVRTSNGETPVLVWLVARAVTCPNPACGALAPLITSYVVADRAGEHVHVRPSIDREAKTYTFEVALSGSPPPPPKMGRGAKFKCIVCERPFPDNYINQEGRAHRLKSVVWATIAEQGGKRVYFGGNATPDMPEVVRGTHWAPEFELAVDPRNIWCAQYGLTLVSDLFSERQIATLSTFSGLVAAAADQAETNATPLIGAAQAKRYGAAIATYLAFVVDKCADYWSTTATWMPRGTVGHAFSKQAIPMTWDYPEVNPFSSIHCSWLDAVDWVAKAVEVLPATPPGQAQQADASASSLGVHDALVSTDPPYYDNISYAGLADYFYVWMRHSLAGVDPDLFSTLLTPKEAELIASPERHGGKKQAQHHFEKGLHAAFANIRDAARKDLPITVYYAFKQAEGAGSAGAGFASTGWETMLEGLLGAGLSIVGTWPLRTERAARSVAMGTNALASSIVLVCRPREAEAGITTRKDLVARLKREMPEALRTLQQENIAPVDLAQSSIGPGMAIFSGYAKILEPDGSAMSVRTALALINQVLDEILAEQEGEFDPDTRWAIGWYEQFGLAEADSGRAILLTQAKNTSLDGLVAAGIVEARRGKTRLLARSEYSTGWDPARDSRIPAWEATQRLVHTLMTEGEGPAADLLARLGGLGDTARDLAYRLYQLAERKGWTDEARAYNSLVVAWSDLARGAESARAAQPAQASLGFE